MRPLVLIIAGLFIKAFSIWQKLQISNSSSNDDTNTDEQDASKKVLKFHTRLTGIYIFILKHLFICHSG